MKSTKAYVLGALIITMSLIIIGISGSYAYYINVVEEVNAQFQGVSVTSGELTMNFTSSQYINATSASLINDSDILTEADYTVFSITLPEDAIVDKAFYTLYLTDTTMTSNFKSNYLKWALYNGDTKVKDGDFNDIELYGENNGLYSANSYELYSSSINKGDTISFKLYIWLSYDENNLQNQLLNGSLSTKVAFIGYTE